MRTDSIADAPSAADLAWEGDRRSLLDLDESERALLEGAARFVAETWPTLPDVSDLLQEARHEGRDDAFGDVAAQLLELGMAEPDLYAPAASLVGITAAVKNALERARDDGALDALVPSREHAATKARRLLIEGRLIVRRVEVAGPHAGLVVAACRGDSSAVYDLGYDPTRKQWRCTCPATRECSHLLALKLVTAVQT